MRVRVHARVWSTVRTVAALMMSVSCLSAFVVIASSVSGPAPTAGAYESAVKGGGFDRCALPTEAQMKTLWDDADGYWMYGMYIGGVNIGCSTSGQSETWEHTVTHDAGYDTEGWDIGLVWVGDQSQCGFTGPYDEYIPSGESAAYTDGVGAAKNAEARAVDLGFGGGAIYFDLENFTNSNSTCLTSARYFVSGWDHELSALGFLGGLYVNHAEAKTFDFGTVPYAIWIAGTVGKDRVYTISDLSNTLWKDHQRLHQFEVEEHTAVVDTYVDLDCATAPLNGNSPWDATCNAEVVS